MKVKGLTKVKGHRKKCNVVVELPEKGDQLWSASSSYVCLSSSMAVKVCVQNNSDKPITLEANKVIGVISAANIVPMMVALSTLLSDNEDSPNMRLGEQPIAKVPSTDEAKPESDRPIANQRDNDKYCRNLT